MSPLAEALSCFLTTLSMRDARFKSLSKEDILWLPRLIATLLFGFESDKLIRIRFWETEHAINMFLETFKWKVENSTCESVGWISANATDESNNIVDTRLSSPLSSSTSQRIQDQSIEDDSRYFPLADQLCCPWSTILKRKKPNYLRDVIMRTWPRSSNFGRHTIVSQMMQRPSEYPMASSKPVPGENRAIVAIPKMLSGRSRRRDMCWG